MGTFSMENPKIERMPGSDLPTENTEVKNSKLTLVDIFGDTLL